MKNVSHRNAPGAISAIALIVRPPRPNVGLVVGFSFDDMSFSLLIRGLQNRGRQCPKRPDGGVRKLEPKLKKPSTRNTDRRLRSLSARHFVVSSRDFITEF